MQRFFHSDMRFPQRRSCSIAAGPSLRKPLLAGMGLIMLNGCLVALPGDAVATGVGADVTAKIDNPGDYTFSIEHDGLARRYLVHVPRTYQATTPAPLLLAFHGGGGDMNYMATDKYYGLISTSEAEGFVAAFPNGFSTLDSGKFATWNAGTCCAGARMAVQLCVTATGGHSWAGGSKPRSSEAPSQAISANDVMWAFFNSVPAATTPTNSK